MGPLLRGTLAFFMLVFNIYFTLVTKTTHMTHIIFEHFLLQSITEKTFELEPCTYLFYSISSYSSIAFSIFQEALINVPSMAVVVPEALE
jgi:hypothetical protein